MNYEIHKLAHELAKDWFYKNQMGVMGAKVVDNFLYVKGGDNGFPHTRAHVKIDLETGKIVETYGAWNCPVSVSEGAYY